MGTIWYLCPADHNSYLHIITEVTPKLDDAGISFHVAHPSEDIAGYIIEAEGRSPLPPFDKDGRG